MRKIDITPIRDIDLEYEKKVATLAERIKGEWNDSVQESYNRYVYQLTELSRKVKRIRCKVETLEKEAEGLKIDELANKADSLCKEAEAV